MSEETEIKTFYHYAMRGGTQLGLLWIAMYASCIASFSSPIYSMFFLALNFSSPFYSARIAKKFRCEECNNTLPYSRAFTFVFIMYLCASLLSAVAQFIYFEFFDNGFIMQLLLQTSKILEENSAQFGNVAIEFKKSVEMLLSLGTKGIVFNILSSNIMNGIILSAIIALFVKHTPQQQKNY